MATSCVWILFYKASSYSCFRFFSLSPVALKVYTLYYTKFQRYLKQSWLQESRKGTQTSKEWRMDALIWRQQCRVDIFNLKKKRQATNKELLQMKQAEKRWWGVWWSNNAVSIWKQIVLYGVAEDGERIWRTESMNIIQCPVKLKHKLNEAWFWAHYFINTCTIIHVTTRYIRMSVRLIPREKCMSAHLVTSIYIIYIHKDDNRKT